MRLGLLWFAANVGALVLGTAALGLLYAGTAGAAALHTARAWRRVGRRPDRLVAGLAATLMPLAAALHTSLLGAALLAMVAAAFLTAPGRVASRKIVEASHTVQCGLFVGLAASSVVLTERYETGGAVALVALVAAYEVGDYLVGSGSSNAYEGPAAGLAGMVVVTFMIGALGIAPFEESEAWLFGALAAALIPLGQVAGSLVLPDAAASAPALRRLDSLLVLGPVWAWGVGLLTS